jgi:UDP-glucose 4-epimerase
LVTGGAGFVGVNLAQRLLSQGDQVIAMDDLSLGHRAFLQPFEGNPSFSFHQIDCAEFGPYHDLVARLHARQPIDEVWHLAANSDIPSGVADPSIDLRRTFLTSFETLRVMRVVGIPILHFASSSAIYGDAGGQPIAEDYGPLEPISNYGAMKLASEAQIRAAAEAFLSRATIFRFPNVVGLPATHGVILDLIRKCRATPDGFDVLGDGTQRKIYLHVEDLIDAMIFIRDHARERYSVFNIGPDDAGVTVRRIAEMVRDRVSPQADIRYGEGGRGWVGDVPRFRYATGRLAAFGWTPQLTSERAVAKAVEQIAPVEVGDR